MVNTRLPTDTWTQIPINSSDIVGLQLHGDFGTIRLINIYNDGDHNEVLQALSKHMHDPTARSYPARPLHYIWMGDFNRHSPLWDEERNEHLFTPHALRATQPLYNLLRQHHMKMALPKDIPTLEARATKNLTRPDNVFCSADLLDNFITCDTEPALWPVKTDHFPIISIIDVAVAPREYTPRPNFRDTEWDEFCEDLKLELGGIPDPETYDTIDELNQAIERLDQAINMCIERHVPMSKPCPASKRWWTKKLAETKKAVMKLGRKSYKLWIMADHPIHNEFYRVRNDYSLQIRKAKAKHWTEWLEGLCNQGVWTASRLVTGPAMDRGRSRIPTLQKKHPTTRAVIQEAAMNEEKSKWLFKEFFPPKPATSTVDPDSDYPEPRWKYEPVTNECLIRCIAKMSPYKATRSGTVPNSVYKNNKDLLVPRLGAIYRAINKLEYYPLDWENTETIALQKPGKPDYSNPAAHRPIVLSSGHVRLYNVAKTEQVVLMAEKHNLLPNNHYGSHPGRSTTDAVHFIVKATKDAWRKGLVVSLLLLDIKGAFPSMAVDQLIHNMRMRGVPKEHTDWILR